MSKFTSLLRPLHSLLVRHMSATGLLLHAVDPEEERFDLNVQHTASEDEVKELDKDLGVSEPKTQVADPDDDLEEPDEDQSGAKISAEEAEAGTEAEKQAIREKKRADRLNQRQRQRQRIETLERQLANQLAANQELHQRVSGLENTNLGTQAAQLQNAALEVEQAEQQLKNVIADATIKQDGVRAAEATAAYVQLQKRKDQIAYAQSQLETQSRQAKAPQPLDQEVVNHAKAFMAKHSWYKGPKAADMDSRILSAIDDTMTKEGWDPRSPTYWTELESRAKDHLPKRFQGSQTTTQGTAVGNEGYNAPNSRTPPKSPVAGSGSNNSGGGERSTKYTLSPERVKAMKEAGFWDDPKKRESMVKRYQAMDRQMAQDRR